MRSPHQRRAVALEALGGRLVIRPVPDAEGFRLFRYWLHEELGLVYYRLRGWI